MWCTLLRQIYLYVCLFVSYMGVAKKGSSGVLGPPQSNPTKIINDKNKTSTHYVCTVPLSIVLPQQQPDVLTVL